MTSPEQLHPEKLSTLHIPDCPCTACFSKCDKYAAQGGIPTNAEWWKTQTVFPVDHADSIREAVRVVDDAVQFVPIPVPVPTAICGACDGLGLKVREVPENTYACGFRSEAYTCPMCQGSGCAMPIPADFKTASAGDSL